MSLFAAGTVSAAEIKVLASGATEEIITTEGAPMSAFDPKRTWNDSGLVPRKLAQDGIEWTVCPVSSCITTAASVSGRSDPSHGIFLDDKAKPSVSYRPTALLFEQGAQYKISKIKFAISVMAVTPATESTKASLAPW